MFKRYSEKEVKALVRRLKEEYDGIVRQGREAFDELKEENKRLLARLLVLEGERDGVTDALLNAEKAGDAIKKTVAAEAENKSRELVLLSEQCRMLLTRLNEKYPDEAEVKDFKVFCDALFEKLNANAGGEEESGSGFNMDDVLNPKEPLDLEKLCRDLGLMEGGE